MKNVESHIAVEVCCCCRCQLHVISLTVISPTVSDQSHIDQSQSNQSHIDQSHSNQSHCQ